MKRKIHSTITKRTSAPNLTLSPDASAMPFYNSLAYCKPGTAPTNLERQSGKGTIVGHVVLERLLELLA